MFSIAYVALLFRFDFFNPIDINAAVTRKLVLELLGYELANDVKIN